MGKHHKKKKKRKVNRPVSQNRVQSSATKSGRSIFSFKSILVALLIAALAVILIQHVNTQNPSSSGVTSTEEKVLNGRAVRFEKVFRPTSGKGDVCLIKTIHNAGDNTGKLPHSIIIQIGQYQLAILLELKRQNARYIFLENNTLTDEAFRRANFDIYLAGGHRRMSDIKNEILSEFEGYNWRAEETTDEQLSLLYFCNAAMVYCTLVPEARYMRTVEPNVAIARTELIKAAQTNAEQQSLIYAYEDDMSASVKKFLTAKPNAEAFILYGANHNFWDNFKSGGYGFRYIVYKNFFPQRMLEKFEPFH